MEYQADLRGEVLKLSPKALAELRSMKHAPVEIVQTMKAVAIMLGAELFVVKDWRQLLKYLNKRGNHLLDDVRRFDPTKLGVKTIANASDLLSNLTYAEVERGSPTAALFLRWAVGMLREADPASLGDEEELAIRMHVPTERERKAAEEKMNEERSNFNWAITQSPWAKPDKSATTKLRAAIRRHRSFFSAETKKREDEAAAAAKAAKVSSSEDEAHEDAPSEPSSGDDDADHIADLMKLGIKSKEGKDKSKVSEPAVASPVRAKPTAQDNRSDQNGAKKNATKKSALGRSRSKKFSSFFE